MNKKGIKLFLLLSTSFLLLECTSKKDDINTDKVSVYVDLDNEAVNKEYVRLWINNKIIFSGYSNSWRMYVASIPKQKKYIKIRTQIINIDSAYFHTKGRSADTTFYYNVKSIDRLGIGYLKAYNGFVVFDSRKKDWWILE